MSTQDNKDSPGVIAIPPLIYAGCLAIGIVLDLVWPLPLLPNALQYALGLAILVASFAIVLPAVLAFREAGTNLDVRKPTTAIVTTGVFRYSRNPNYLALTLLYVGIAITADSIWILVLLIPALAILHTGVILREERYLEQKFGEEYLTYKRRVRRWL